MVYARLGSLRARTLQAQRIGSLLLTGFFIVGVGLLGQRFDMPSFVPEDVPAETVEILASPSLDGIAENPPPTAEMASETEEAGTLDAAQAMAAATPIAPAPESVSRVVTLGEGRTFARMLTDAGISAEAAMAASKALGDVYDHKKLQAGKDITLSMTRTGDQSTLDQIVFQPDVMREIVITRSDSGAYDAQMITTPLERKRFAVRSEIKSSLFATGEKEGIPPAVMAAFIRAYSHEIDFQRDIHEGDGFELLYDQPTAKDGTSIGQGIVVYAALIVGGKKRPLYRVTFGDGAIDYFDETGRSVKRSLLRTPIEGSRVTSRFGMRRHPILGYSKMHQGIDFGAPTGTPIYAAGSGIVEQARYNGAYGRFVLLRHNGRTQTAYAHLSRFAKDIRPGARISQGDILGYVGSTGRSTGPHLHYEVRIDNRQVSPLSVSMPVGRTLEGSVLRKFKEGQAKIRNEFLSLLDAKNAERTKAETTSTTPPGPSAQKTVPGRGQG